MLSISGLESLALPRPRPSSSNVQVQSAGSLSGLDAPRLLPPSTKTSAFVLSSARSVSFFVNVNHSALGRCHQIMVSRRNSSFFIWIEIPIISSSTGKLAREALSFTLPRLSFTLPASSTMSVSFNLLVTFTRLSLTFPVASKQETGKQETGKQETSKQGKQETDKQETSKQEMAN